MHIFDVLQLRFLSLAKWRPGQTRELCCSKGLRFPVKNNCIKLADLGKLSAAVHQSHFSCRNFTMVAQDYQVGILLIKRQ